MGEGRMYEGNKAVTGKERREGALELLRIFRGRVAGCGLV